SARHWINRSIIEKARFLMQQSDLTLKEISDKLHFPDQSSFGRFFKSHPGIKTAPADNTAGAAKSFALLTP
ncbi:MAG: helix-turn-helix domain-containing protein, partial [Campylobacter sp.]|nr:helix-turn-helix domain-containing protein [Campylobacter sp.]